MSFLQRQSHGLSRPIKDKFIGKLFPTEFSDEYIIQLTINFADENININELSSYLRAIYKVDGLLHGSAYRSYVHNSYQQIEITRIRSGSVITEIERLITSPDSYNLGIIWLFLKYLPQGIAKLVEVTSNVVDVLNKREDYLEKREKRKMRKSIRRIVLNDQELEALTDKDKDKLVKLLSELYEANTSKLNAMVRFSEKYVKSVTLRPRKR